MGNQFVKLDFHSRLDFFSQLDPRVVGIPSTKKPDPQILICLHISTTRWHVHNYRAFPPQGESHSPKLDNVLCLRGRRRKGHRGEWSLKDWACIVIVLGRESPLLIPGNLLKTKQIN